MADDTLFQDTLELLKRAIEQLGKEELPWLEMVARDQIADQCLIFQTEYYNRGIELLGLKS